MGDTSTCDPCALACAAMGSPIWLSAYTQCHWTWSVKTFRPHSPHTPRNTRRVSRSLCLQLLSNSSCDSLSAASPNSCEGGQPACGCGRRGDSSAAAAGFMAGAIARGCVWIRAASRAAARGLGLAQDGHCKRRRSVGKGDSFSFSARETAGKNRFPWLRVSAARLRLGGLRCGRLRCCRECA